MPSIFTTTRSLKRCRWESFIFPWIPHILRRLLYCCLSTHWLDHALPLMFGNHQVLSSVSWLLGCFCDTDVTRTKEKKQILYDGAFRAMTNHCSPHLGKRDIIKIILMNRSRYLWITVHRNLPVIMKTYHVYHINFKVYSTMFLCLQWHRNPGTQFRQGLPRTFILMTQCTMILTILSSSFLFL